MTIDLSTIVPNSLKRSFLRVNIGNFAWIASASGENSNPGLLSVRVTSRFDQKLSTCTIETTSSSFIDPMNKVEVDLGYDGYGQRVFTGYVDDVGLARPPWTQTVQCSDVLKLAQDNYYLDEVSYAPPGTAAKTVVQTFLTDSGITNYSLDTPTITGGGEFILATVHEASFKMISALDAIEQVSDLIGWRICCSPSGVVRWLHQRPVPSGSANGTTHTYVAGGNLSIVSFVGHKNDRALRNYVRIMGYGSLVSNASAASAYVPTPPQYRKCAVGSEYYDTQALADMASARILADLNRLTYSAEMVVEGNPFIQVGDTLAVTESSWAGASAYWFVYGVEHTYGSDGFMTNLSLVGGTLSGRGTNPDPDGSGGPGDPPTGDGIGGVQADFTYILEREKTADGDTRVVSLDGSTSTSRDGAVTAYSWTDGTTVKTGQRVNYAYTADATKTFTLTVTDSNSNTGTMSLDINVATTNTEIRSRTLILACPDGVRVSFDGGNTWRLDDLT